MTHIHDYSLCESFRKIKDEISKRVHFVFCFNTSQCQPLSASQNQPLSLSESSHTLRILAYQPPCPPLSVSQNYNNQPSSLTAIMPISHHTNQAPCPLLPPNSKPLSLNHNAYLPSCLSAIMHVIHQNSKI